MTSSIKKSKLVPLIIIAIGALIVFLLFASKPQPPKQETQEKEWLITTQEVTLETISPQINLLGTVESPFDTTISAAISADVLAVPVRDGQVVKQGEVLIKLDDREVALQLKQKQADLADIKSQIVSEKNRYEADKIALKEEERLLDIAEQGVNRQAKLKASNLVAQERYDSAESSRAQQALSITARKLNIADHPSRLNQLQARLSRAETAVQDAELDLERTFIKAPYDGVITSVFIAPGERAQIGQSLVSLYDNTNIEVRAQIPDKYVRFVQKALLESKSINAQTSSYGEIIDLSLARLSGQANPKNGGVDAIFVPKLTGNSLVLNNAVQVQVALPPLINVVSLPVSAIYGTDRIYKVEDSRLQAIKVDVLGHTFDHEGAQSQVIISSKLLNAQDRIVTTQLPNAITGLKVRERGAE